MSQLLEIIETQVNQRSASYIPVSKIDHIEGVISTGYSGNMIIHIAAMASQRKLLINESMEIQDGEEEETSRMMEVHIQRLVQRIYELESMNLPPAIHRVVLDYDSMEFRLENMLFPGVPL